ncbi:hypothetical protein [Micromonospora zhanjiangensis]|uniref:HTH luxR-type domain-containing protein n=1 Tax=Micromonospora zhanjiangensis TaxID=1522057 RepID=A0ABV8KY47_9ACTN
MVLLAAEGLSSTEIGRQVGMTPSKPSGSTDQVLISEGLTNMQTNHDNHLHVRYCETVHPNSLYDC